MPVEAGLWRAVAADRVRGSPHRRSCNCGEAGKSWHCSHDRNGQLQLPWPVQTPYMHRMFKPLLVVLALAACGGKKAAPPPSIEAEVWSLSHDLGHALMRASAGKDAKAAFADVSARATKLVGSAPK